MILAALLLQAAAPQSAVDAERAMEAAAQREGRWTAVRRFAAPGAEVLAPQAVPVALAYDGPDPSPAYHWWISDSYVSCDGRTAVNTGPWEREGTHGWFTTVWQRQDDGSWKWILDSGDRLATPRPRPASAQVRQARCDGTTRPTLRRRTSPGAIAYAYRGSDDQSLAWTWTVEADGGVRLSVSLWNGAGFDDVIADPKLPAN
jgi:hypothetical protein